MLVHFIVVEGGDVRPLCGSWAHSPSWTRVPVAVTCPRCRELLEDTDVDRAGAGGPAAPLDL